MLCNLGKSEKQHYKEARNKNPVSESAELFLASTNKRI